MHEVIQRLLAKGPTLTDGAWGTELQALGLNPGECPDVWNLTHPDLVLKVANAYVDAGSHLILTNTFGANRFRLQADGFAEKVAEINREGVRISREAAKGKALVFASIGPTGKLMMDENVEPKSIHEAFKEQAQALAAAGAHGLVVETMSDLLEADLAVTAARSTGLPVVACMVFDSGKNGDCTMMGDPPEKVAQVLTNSGADVIGANCGNGIAGFAGVCRRLRTATLKPLWLKPNAGLPQMNRGRLTYNMTPHDFANQARGLVNAGADFIGGCCGTSPEFIAALARCL